MRLEQKGFVFKTLKGKIGAIHFDEYGTAADCICNATATLPPNEQAGGMTFQIEKGRFALRRRTGVRRKLQDKMD